MDFVDEPARRTPVLAETQVLVVGGGNTAMDCARVAKRLGADVSIVYRRTRVEMPAITAEIDEAMEERIMFRYHTNPVKIIQDEDLSRFIL